MLLVVFVCHLLVGVLSGPPPPPHDVRVDKLLLTWRPAAEDSDVTYTVQSSSSDGEVWTDVPACVRTTSTSCDLTSVTDESELGCVALRVQAVRRRLTSVPVEACSERSDSCTPEFTLSARSGSLTVHLSRNHSLALQHGNHAKHRVLYGKEGERLTDYTDDVASVIIKELQPGQRYCATVRFTYFDKLVGPPSCARCELIPETKTDDPQTGVIAALVVVFVLLLMALGIGYCLVCKREQIKQWLRPPYEIPPFFMESVPMNHPVVFASHQTENCDHISVMATEDAPAPAAAASLRTPQHYAG